MNMKENTLSHIYLTKADLLGRHEWSGKLDLLNIVMVGLSKEIPGREEDCELHRLLSALLSSKMEAPEKLKILETEYNIPAETGIRKDVNVMCNLSEGVWEEAMERGLAEGMEKGIEKGLTEVILKMYENNFTLEQITVATGKDIKQIKEAIGRS